MAEVQNQRYFVAIPKSWFEERPQPQKIHRSQGLFFMDEATLNNIYNQAGQMDTDQLLKTLNTTDLSPFFLIEIQIPAILPVEQIG